MRCAAVAVVALACASPALASTPSVAAGKVVFKTHCGSCHTFKAAGTVGKGASPGPVLTNMSVTKAMCTTMIAGMSAGMMPSFIGTLTPQQIADVTAFVVTDSRPSYK